MDDGDWRGPFPAIPTDTRPTNTGNQAIVMDPNVDLITSDSNSVGTYRSTAPSYLVGE